MSYTAEDILGEFAEASRYGKTNHTDRYARWADLRWWNEIGSRAQEALLTNFVIVPLTVEQELCDKCGRVVETRAGTSKKFHLGLPRKCGVL